MKRYLGYIAALFAMVATTGCAYDGLDNSPQLASDDVVTVIGRITRFNDVDVATRGVKDEDESKLTSMAMALFPVTADGSALANDGKCVYYQFTDNQAELLFSIDRTTSIGSAYDNQPFAMYVFTNMPGMGAFEVGDKLEDMLETFYDVENIDIPTNGFPMIGSLGDTFSTNIDKDGKVFILSPRENGNLVAPKVDGTTQTLLTVPMKAMYAKVNFTIEVRPDQTIEGNYSPQFTLESYTVNNVPSKVDYSSTTNSDSDVLASGFSGVVSGNKVASEANTVNFSFYLPERLLTPATTWENYNYPFGTGDAIRDEDLVYRQRYKSKLLGNNQKATNIVLKGRFRDHQNISWDVDYTIHLGADNFGDFNILRNSEYNNIVTIRGIQTSNDMSDDQSAISIDHRVNITRTQPAIITLRREVLLDSHFEVRPLRVRKSDVDYEGDINAVMVEVVDPGKTTWMRLERSFGDGTPAGSPETKVLGQTKSIYIDENPNSPSYGKRRFFTYNLIDGVNADATDATLVNSKSVVLPITEETECCWIYVDECTETGDGVRAGKIKVSYGKWDGSNPSSFVAANIAYYPDINYIINQRKLFNVTGESGRNYNIEYHEEYLYNYDADDEYGDTEYNGMEWGLNGIQLSYDHEALYFKSKTGDWANGIVDYFTGEAPAFYDFYISSHDSERMADPKQVTLHEYKGFDFCKEIIQTVNGFLKDDSTSVDPDDDPNDNINVLQLDEQPKSAVEYCYNKNKRNNKGEVVSSDGSTNNLHWYLPAVDEIEDIVTSEYGTGQKTYARFIEFQDQDYWSCQPAFIQNYAHMSWTFIIWPLDYWGTFYYDDIGDTNFDKNNNTDRKDIGSARSTSVKYNGVDYDPTPSGTNGYYSYYDADNDSEPYKYSGTYNGVKIGSIEREAGNQPRNEKNRVRGVRK